MTYFQEYIVRHKANNPGGRKKEIRVASGGPKEKPETTKTMNAEENTSW